MCACSRKPIPAFSSQIGRHSSGRFGDISTHDHETSEAWLIDLSAPAADPTLIAARQSGVQYEVEHHPAFNGGPALIIRTNADGAEDFKIVWSPLATAFNGGPAASIIPRGEIAGSGGSALS